MSRAQLATDALKTRVGQLPNDTLAAFRDAALQRLLQDGMPETSLEDWKYTDLGTAIDISNRSLASAQTASVAITLPEPIASVLDSIDADWLVIGNGHIDLSRFSPASDICVERYSESSAPEIPDFPLSQLNAALLQDGLRLQVNSATERPLGILLIDTVGEAAATSQSSVSVEIAPGCDAELIEYHASSGDGDHYHNAILQIALAESSQLSMTKIQDRQRHHVQTGRLSVHAGKNSRFQLSSYDFGGALIRNDVDIDIAAPGADISFDGLYLVSDEQHVDNHTRVDHRVGPAVSAQEYRGILTGRGRAVWNGKAVVHVGADGTDANQANHNLLLSTQSEIDAKPELEIYADDVKCSHGTTVGQLDEVALFYLRTRGLDEQTARQLLVRAFATDLIQRTPISACKDHLARLVDARLAEITGSKQHESS